MADPNSLNLVEKGKDLTGGLWSRVQIKMIVWSRENNCYSFTWASKNEALEKGSDEWDFSESSKLIVEKVALRTFTCSKNCSLPYEKS